RPATSNASRLSDQRLKPWVPPCRASRRCPTESCRRPAQQNPRFPCLGELRRPRPHSPKSASPVRAGRFGTRPPHACRNRAQDACSQSPKDGHRQIDRRVACPSPVRRRSNPFGPGESSPPRPKRSTGQGQVKPAKEHIVTVAWPIICPRWRRRHAEILRAPAQPPPRVEVVLGPNRPVCYTCPSRERNKLVLDCIYEGISQKRDNSRGRLLALYFLDSVRRIGPGRRALVRRESQRLANRNRLAGRLQFHSEHGHQRIGNVAGRHLRPANHRPRTRL